MTVTVKFWSYFRDHTGCDETSLEVDNDATLDDINEYTKDDLEKHF